MPPRARPPARASADILAARVDVQRALATALDELEFNLIIGADDTRSANEAAIHELVEVQVNRIRAAGEISALVRRAVILALNAAVASDSADDPPAPIRIG